MNINLEYPLFRFVVPPSIFWGILMFLQVIENASFDSKNAIFFVGSGFIISAIGTGIARLIDLRYGPVWVNPVDEIRHWEKVSKKEAYVQKKIENVWGFYSMNLNSCVALVGGIIFVLVSSNTAKCPILLGLGSSLILFAALAAFSYKKIFCEAKYLKPPHE